MDKMIENLYRVDTSYFDPQHCLTCYMCLVILDCWPTIEAIKN